jgi:hypothetical protein
MTTRFLQAKRTVMLGLCAIGFAIPVAIQSMTPVTAHDHSPAIAQTDLAALEVRARQLVGWLGTKDFAKVRSGLAPQLQTLWSAEKIQQVWDSQVIEQTGPVRKILKSKVIDAVNAELVLVTVQFEKYTGDVIVTFNPSGQVIAADFPEFRNIQTIGENFIEKLARKDYAAARGDLSPLLKAEVFPARIQSGWENFLRRTGPFQRIVGTQVRKGSDTDGVDVVLVTVQFEKVTDTLILVFDDNKRIVNVDFPIGN